jgi:hypothetical protein
MSQQQNALPAFLPARGNSKSVLLIQPRPPLRNVLSIFVAGN